MEYRNLGTSGLQVSVLGIGGNVFARNVDQAGTDAVVHKALDLGVNLIDTSDTYTQGESEKFLGRALGSRRHEAVIATKALGPMGEGPNNRQASRQHLTEAVEGSLRRLNTDYIDLYQMHNWDATTPIEETFSALSDFVRQGKVRYIGVSNYKGWQIAHTIGICRANGFTQPVSNQPEYSLLERGIEADIMPACRNYGLGILPFYPLAGGFLTGKYKRGQDRPPDSRGAYFANNPRAVGRDRVQFVERWENERYWTVLEGLEAFAEKRGHTMAELAVAWVAAQPMVCTVIAGASRPSQVGDNARATAWKLMAADLEEIDRIAR